MIQKRARARENTEKERDRERIIKKRFPEREGEEEEASRFARARCVVPTERETHKKRERESNL